MKRRLISEGGASGSSLPPTPAVSLQAGPGSAWDVAEFERLRVFVPCVLKNDSQTSGVHWGPRAKRARQQIDAVCAAVLGTLRAHGMSLRASPTVPKSIEFVAYHPPPAFDEPDGLAAATKHVRDGLRHAGIIANDAPQDGHVFAYAQVLTKAHRGVLVTITLRPRGA